MVLSLLCVLFLSSFSRSFAFGNERMLRVCVEKEARDSDFEFSFPFWGEAPRGGFLRAEDSRMSLLSLSMTFTIK
jgi:hypothetical protein